MAGNGLDSHPHSKKSIFGLEYRVRLIMERDKAWLTPNRGCVNSIGK